MARINNLRDSLAVRQRRDIDKTSRAAILQSSSVTRGGVRIASAEGLLVEGSERVTGLLIVDGTLQVTGTESITGTLVVSGGQIITGTFRIDGETLINGHTVINGPTDIAGALNLSGTMTVTAGGQIVVGNLTLSPGGDFGGQITAGGVGVLYLQAVNVLASGDLTAVNLALTGGITSFGNITAYNDIIVNDDLTVGGDVSAAGRLEVGTLPTPPVGSTVHQVVADGTGKFYRGSTV